MPEDEGNGEATVESKMDPAEASLRWAKQPEPKDEWDQWEASIQAQVDKLIDDSRMLKLATLAIGGISLAALGIGAMMGKTVQQLIKGMQQLGANQMEIANALGMAEQAPEPTPDGPTGIKNLSGEPVDMTAYDNGRVDVIKVEDAKTFDVVEAEVAPAFDGPATEASEAAKAQLKADKDAGIIGLAKEGENVGE